MSSFLDVVIQYENDVPVVVSLCHDAQLQVGNTVDSFATEAEAEAEFLKIVRSGVHATGEYSREVLERNSLPNPPY